jgi:4a-hydroxytetrahydrobiopterin dehydratase
MNPLASQDLERCTRQTPALSLAEQKSLLDKIDDWTVIHEHGVSKLCKKWTFPDFVTAQAFAVQVGELAESANHHPSILLEWGRVTVCWWTHTIAGLHINDFIMAARCDNLD